MPYETFDLNTVQPDDRQPTKAKLFDATGSGAWRGCVPGNDLGGENTILAYGNDTVGEGPALHVHPYDETFIVIEGRARFYVGDQVIDAEAGDVVFGPKGVPHRFENLGPRRSTFTTVGSGIR
ncbi:cupin domain-containing protein [Peteryoungia ipomoeae]|uniref:cupin domain-containing protein n=1 Tax=Peteryoungia ipomoeae TaxID=1210932 RepID=UPI001FEA46F6|nr:cupin domain-containing protein [Peteryoungia ipomoeae]